MHYILTVCTLQIKEDSSVVSARLRAEIYFMIWTNIQNQPLLLYFDKKTSQYSNTTLQPTDASSLEAIRKNKLLSICLMFELQIALLN